MKRKDRTPTVNGRALAACRRSSRRSVARRKSLLAPAEEIAEDVGLDEGVNRSRGGRDSHHDGFYDDEGHWVTVGESSALFYWLLRYDANMDSKGFLATERTVYCEGNLDKARDL